VEFGRYRGIADIEQAPAIDLDLCAQAPVRLTPSQMSQIEHFLAVTSQEVLGTAE
jgi:hypothetical protein